MRQTVENAKSANSVKVAIVGASGYTGAELAALCHQHPGVELAGLFVSHGSQAEGQLLSELHPKWRGQLDLPLEAITLEQLQQLADSVDAIALATPHELSAQWVPELVQHKAVLFDLSGAFRLPAELYPSVYGFSHQQPELVAQACYGLAEWSAPQIAEASLVAVPGCYPTASLLALKPLFAANALSQELPPVINAVSGVSGAGRKASLTNSFCEVSLAPYGVLGHRHQPEISFHLGQDVIFTPHLGNFKRGILATITAKLAPGVSSADLEAIYRTAYQSQPAVRLLPAGQWPSIDGVANTPYCDLAWKLDESTGYLVVCSAIDNLLKGAAAQALQCIKIRFELEGSL